MNAQTSNEEKFTLKVRARKLLPQDFKVEKWESLQPFFEELLNRKIENVIQLKSWLQDISELEAVISEDACWRQIRVTTDTNNEQFEKDFTFFVTEIEPKIKPYSFELNKKLVASPFIDELPNELYYPYLRSVKNAIDLYREENNALQAEINLLAQQYGMISGKMTVELDGKTYTLQQAARFLQSPDSTLRETVYAKIAQRRLEDKEQLNELFEKLLALRLQVAKNAGFDNYRDYKFRELGRFDYNVEDTFSFHESVKQHILPLHKKLMEAKKQKLGLEKLKPWDTDATPVGEQPLHPFESGDELTHKSIATFGELDSFFAQCITTMSSMQRLDLESRIGKAPGGYNCPLAETGVPFIFMNAAGTLNDVITMMHEGGHAFHSFLSHDLHLSSFKEYPMEMAELASMSMELFTMDHWDNFFKDENDLKKAKLEELDRVISVMPWIATIDKFQHWLYTNPGHTEDERKDAWLQILNEFSTGLVDWSGWEDARAYQWQKQLHLFEVPFYYIEYGIAQLGAIAMWRQYRKHPQQALNNYKNALSQGYTKNLKELYKIAGIKFDFSPTYVKELAAFVDERWEEMKN